MLAVVFDLGLLLCVADDVRLAFAYKARNQKGLSQIAVNIMKR